MAQTPFVLNPAYSRPAPNPAPLGGGFGRGQFNPGPQTGSPPGSPINWFTIGTGADAIQGQHMGDTTQWFDPKMQQGYFGQASHNDQFNRTFDLFSSELAKPMNFNGAGGGNFSGGGGGGGSAQQIPVGPIWTPQQEQEKINAMRARGDQATAQQKQTLANNMAGAYGSKSPLASLLNAQYDIGNRADQSTNQRQISEEMATANAQHAQQAGMANMQAAASVTNANTAAASNAYNANLQAQNQWNQMQFNSRNALIGALAGIM